MKNFLIRVAVNGVALWVAALVIPGIHLAENESTISTKVLTIVLVALSSASSTRSSSPS